MSHNQQIPLEMAEWAKEIAGTPVEEAITNQIVVLESLTRYNGQNIGCLNCKRPYEPVRAHPHYCDSCVKECSKCLELKGIWSFSFKKESPVYKFYKLSHAQGVLVGPENFAEMCSSCERGVLPRESRKDSGPIVDSNAKAAMKSFLEDTDEDNVYVNKPKVNDEVIEAWGEFFT